MPPPARPPGSSYADTGEKFARSPTLPIPKRLIRYGNRKVVEDRLTV